MCGKTALLWNFSAKVKKRHYTTIYEGRNFNSGYYLFTTDTK